MRTLDRLKNIYIYNEGVQHSHSRKQQAVLGSPVVRGQVVQVQDPYLEYRVVGAEAQVDDREEGDDLDREVVAPAARQVEEDGEKRQGRALGEEGHLGPDDGDRDDGADDGQRLANLALD